jgi:hypothetical protein
MPAVADHRRLALLAALVALAGCSEANAPDDQTQPVEAPKISRIVPPSEVLAGAHIPTLDPAKMDGSEIRKALGAGPYCEFKYTSTSEPVLAMNPLPAGGQAGAVIKLNDNLVVLRSESAGPQTVLSAEGIRITLRPEEAQSNEAGRQRPADMVFEVADGLKAGYRGYYRCLDGASGRAHSANR